MQNDVWYVDGAGTLLAEFLLQFKETVFDFVFDVCRQLALVAYQFRFGVRGLRSHVLRHTWLQSFLWSMGLIVFSDWSVRGLDRLQGHVFCIGAGHTLVRRSRLIHTTDVRVFEKGFGRLYHLIVLNRRREVLAWTSIVIIHFAGKWVLLFRKLILSLRFKHLIIEVDSPRLQRRPRWPWLEVERGSITGLVRLTRGMHRATQTAYSWLELSQLFLDVGLDFHFSELRSLTRMLQVSVVELWQLDVLAVSLCQHFLSFLLFTFRSTTMHSARMAQVRHLHPGLGVLPR